MAEQITFNDALSVAGINPGITTLTGQPTITYGNPNSVMGSLSLTAAGAVQAQTYTNLMVTQTGTASDNVTPIYTLTGSNSLTSISITYTGQAPNSMTAEVTAIGGLLPIASGSGSVSSSVVCFAAGTLIKALRGDVAVEHLKVGDLVINSSGQQRPIRWIGCGTISCKNHPRPYEVMPIRISSHAFGQDRPCRDLFVSPCHSICVDMLGEVLIPASSLVNGSTVQQVEVDDVTYWHVELESHDVILAENLPAESYIDMGNRGFFREAKVVDLAAVPDADQAQRSHADFCRPFVDRGPILDVVKAQMRRRAESLGWERSDTIDMHLVVDGRMIYPILRGSSARFEVPAGAKDVWLQSPSARPSDVIGGDDSRELGLYIGALRIDDGFGLRDVAIDDPRLCIGFHSVEEGSRRWTTGRCLLPAALWEGCADSFYLRVDLAREPLPRWIAPGTDPVAAERPRLSIVA